MNDLEPTGPQGTTETDWADHMGGLAAVIGPITEALIAWAEQPRPRPQPMVGAYCRALDALTKPARAE